MSEATNSTLILDDLTIGDPISQHHGVKCCPAIREATDERYIVKIISIPASQVQLDALLLTGAYPTPAHALEYFRSRAEEVLQEVDILNRLHTMEGFLPITHAEIRKCEGDVGYEVYLVSPYKRSLERQMQLEPLTHLGAVNLGLDLCAALAICRRAGYLYIDLKPSNVYITPNQGYRISDLGFVSLNSLKYASYPEQYRSIYTAPEIPDAMSSLNARIDIYALGLILYQVYNNGELPIEYGDVLPPPTYADYEMAEIILKACHPNPIKRWADPLQMGQAIVSYMQRNSVNDTPIVPPPPEPPAEPEVAETEEAPVPAEAEVVDDPGKILDSILTDLTTQEPDTNDPAQEDPAEPEAEDTDSEVDCADTEHENIEEPVSEPLIELSFIDDASDDETVPSDESAAEINAELIFDEVQEMLARADILISHELPEPAVAPDPIEVPFPAPIILLDDTEDAEQEMNGETALDNDYIPSEEGYSEEPVEDDSKSKVEASENTDLAGEADSDLDWDDEEEDIYTVSEFYSDDPELNAKPSNRGRNAVIIIACIVLLAALITGGVMFYRHYYLKTVESFTINGSVDSLTAIVNSSIADELLTVVCTDTYGNTRIQEVVDGRAYFTNLTPNTQYRVQLNISGFHKLQGMTAGNYTTDAQTEILNFNAIAGPEDGSVILSFAVNGPDSDQWTVGYSTGNSPETLLSFSGHTATVTDLIIGSEYLFRLIPGDDQYLTGTWLLRYTPQQIVYAQELSIRSCSEGSLHAVWSIPEGLVGQSWNVRCYNEHGYDQSLTTMDSQAQFNGLDHNYGYTVEVTAVGMTQSASAAVTAHPITLSSLTAAADKNNVLVLNWAFNGEVPAEGWILDYTVDGGSPITVSCKENTAKIPLYPGSKYEIDVRPVGDITCFGKHLSYEADKAPMFSKYKVSAKDMSFYMCLTPEKNNWDRFDVPRSDYKETFKVGERASFLVELWKNYKSSKDKITVTYIIRDKNGVPVSMNSKESTWNKLWSNKFCELDIPQMPETAGEYTIDIYFNGQQINEKTLSFTVT